MTADKRTIVLIHGLWMTPTSWDPFRRYYEDRGANDHKCWRAPAVTSFMEFPGRSHLIVTQAGWEELADNALLWALCHARNRGVSESKSEVAA
jgi:hypothetical protein